jgi:hypothetical protein
MKNMITLFDLWLIIIILKVLQQVINIKFVINLM